MGQGELDFPKQQERVLVINNVENISRSISVKETPHGVLVKEVIVVQTAGESKVILNSLMALGIIFVGMQIVSFFWKKLHRDSFYSVSGGVLLFFPLATAVLSRSWRFVCFWLIFCPIYGMFVAQVVLQRRPGLITTNIYRRYRRIFQASTALSFIGYVLVAYGFFKRDRESYVRGIFLLTYVMYFTLIIRTGFSFIRYKSGASMIPVNIGHKKNGCPMCGEEIEEKKRAVLECQESFHLECLKNWKIFGKKNTCPSCRKLVDLEHVEMNLWEKNEHVFTQVLDFADNLILTYAVTQGAMFLFDF